MKIWKIVALFEKLHKITINERSFYQFKKRVQLAENRSVLSWLSWKTSIHRAIVNGTRSVETTCRTFRWNSPCELIRPRLHAISARRWHAARNICSRPLHFLCFWNNVIYRRTLRSFRYLLVPCTRYYCRAKDAYIRQTNLFNARDEC